MIHAGKGTNFNGETGKDKSENDDLGNSESRNGESGPPNFTPQNFPVCLPLKNGKRDSVPVAT